MRSARLRLASFRLGFVFNLSGSEIVVILLLALVVIGPDKLPDAMRRAGKTYAEIKKLSSGFQDEVRKGFDLLVIGMDKVVRDDGGFDGTINAVVSGFDGLLAIVVARVEHLRRPVSDGLRILVPVSGSGVSRRGAEIAVALARTSSQPLSFQRQSHHPPKRPFS